MPDLSPTCSACGFARIPGLTSCVNCGEPAGVAFDITVQVIRPIQDPEKVARGVESNRLALEHARRGAEGRALEYAGDTEDAIAIYEQMIVERCRFHEPYKRLAIVYAKAKRRADEERAVRAALAQFGGDSSSWFVVRLAKIIAQQKRAQSK